MLLGLVTAFLAVYNNATNLARLPDRWYVPTNLAVGAALVAGARFAGVSWADLGLAPAAVPAGAVWGLGVAAVVALALAAGRALPLTRPLFDDARVARLSGGGLAYTVLLRIPVGTALFEELAFRGVLLALWTGHTSVLTAVVVSSAVFGVWHVGPTIVALELNAVTLDRRGRAAVAGSVLATAVAGVGLCLLVLHTGSLVAPFIAHVATNSFGTLAAYLAQRR